MHAQILSPSGGSFKSLIEAHQVSDVVMSVTDAVATSFAVDKSRMTQAEAKRRVSMSFDIFCQLRRDKLWSVDRISQSLTRFLRCELDGQSWEPETRGAWFQPG